MKSTLKVLWYVEVVFSTLRFLISPDAHMLSRLTLILGAVYTLLYVEELKVSIQLVLLFMKKFPIVPFLLLLDYGIARRVDARSRFIVEFVILWGRFFMSPQPPRSTQLTWNATSDCERALSRIVDDLYRIGKDFSAWRCITNVTPAIASRDASRPWYDHLAGPRLWLTLFVTFVSIAVYRGNGKSLLSSATLAS